MAKRKFLRKNTRSTGLLQRFNDEEDGVAAVEAAIVIAMLSGAFIAMADLSVEAHTQSRLSNALRASVQYIANEGRNLDDAEQLFKDSYGSDRALFSTSLACSCAKPRTDFSIDDSAQGTAGTQEPDAEPPLLGGISLENITMDSVQNADGTWADCTMTSCTTGLVVKYLELKGTSKVRNLVKNEEVEVNVHYSVRVE